MKKYIDFFNSEKYVNKEFNGYDSFHELSDIRNNIFNQFFNKMINKLFIHEEYIDNLFNGKPKLFIGNHQNILEVICLPVLFLKLGLTCKAIGRNNDYTEWATNISQTIFSESDISANIKDINGKMDPMHALKIYNDMLENKDNIILYANGTRSLSDNEHVNSVSSYFIDNAIKNGYEVVPFSVRGGLTKEIHSSKMLLSDNLSPLTFVFDKKLDESIVRSLDRKNYILESINKSIDLFQDRNDKDVNNDLKILMKNYEKVAESSKFILAIIESIDSIQAKKFLNYYNTDEYNDGVTIEFYWFRLLKKELLSNKL